MKTEKEYCKLGKHECGGVADKKSIRFFGSCRRCILEEQLGHPYIPKTWDCECGKKFMSKQNLDRHKDKFKHRAIYQLEIN